MATAQDSDGELRSLLETGTSLQFKQLCLPLSKRFLYCDTSTDKVGPYVPVSFRKKVFDLLHGLSHPGIKATTDLIKKRFVWSSINKDIRMWCRYCVACQKSKIQHTKAPLGYFRLSNARFSHIHIVVGPLPPSNGNKFVLTVIDRFCSWPETFPMSDQLADTVARTLYDGWIARFGVPEIITDRGTNFESNLFQALIRFPQD
ncbi:hypothetical protein AVEN_227093-1 [Araneus ventricosus]|uniref:RNA-directed DNA polymerase n=1 Tax=Araneus ventricosus TaxID=182803 RepID=A0A4Y2BVQ3_ARAVE|nr:hypothetical protein AVEN_227093-1 [Araneus ventricosus]